MRRIRQRYDNDCAIAAVSMATGIPWHKCAAMARAKYGWRPTRKTGVCYNWLLTRLGWDTEFHPGIAFGLRPKVNHRRAVVSVRSINVRGKNHYHAVAIVNGRVLDPSPRRQVSAERIKRGARNVMQIIGRHT